MNDVILGNAFSLGAAVFDLYVSSRKKANQILILQCITMVLFSLSYFVLKGYSAIAQNLVGILRNLFALKKIDNKIINVLFAIAPIPLGLWMNNLGWLGLIPIAANIEYSVMVLKFSDNARMLKLGYLINTACFIYFNFVVKNYFLMASNVVLVISLTVSLLKSRTSENAETAEKTDN